MNEYSIRPLMEKDAPGMLEWMQDSKITCYFRFDGSEISLKQCLSFIGKSQEDSDSLHYAIVDDQDQYLGTVSLKNIDQEKKEAEYAISLRSCAHGTGASVEGTRQILQLAFRQLGLEEVFLNVLADNYRANAFYRKMGFRFQKREEHALYLKGRWRDLNWYVIDKYQACPKYSIIIPCYNCQHFLPTSVGSVLDQTLENYELILVEDGSADGTEELCNQYADKYPQIRSFHKDNTGVSGARSFGITHALGEYLIFLDCDDTIEPWLLRETDRILAENNPDLVIYGMYFDYYHGKNLERSELLVYPKEELLQRSQLADRFQELFRCNSLSSACNKIFRADIIREHGLQFTEGMTLYEDFAFVLTYLQYCGNVYCWKEGLYHYRLDAGEDHLRRRVANLDKMRKNMECLTQACQGFATEESEKIVGALYLQLLYRHLLEGELTLGGYQEVCRVCHSDTAFQYARKYRDGFSETDQTLLNLLQQEASPRLQSWIKARKRKRRLRNSVKKLLKALRLR